ncbi:MAG TPA: hypothetical protein VFX50_14250 [Gemmatimonadales bacterium]|nr:hypothetical protein [Gemmatimonadales bacterium]
MLATVAITLLTSVTLQDSLDVPPLGAPGSALVPVIISLGAGLAVFALRDRMPARTATQTEDDWWARNLGRATAIWAIAEGLALLGGVFYLVTGAPMTLSSAALGLALLAFCTPANLIDR